MWVLCKEETDLITSYYHRATLSLVECVDTKDVQLDKKNVNRIAT